MIYFIPLDFVRVVSPPRVLLEESKFAFVLEPVFPLLESALITLPSLPSAKKAPQVVYGLKARPVLLPQSRSPIFPLIVCNLSSLNCPTE